MVTKLYICFINYVLDCRWFMFLSSEMSEESKAHNYLIFQPTSVLNICGLAPNCEFVYICACVCVCVHMRVCVCVCV